MKIKCLLTYFSDTVTSYKLLPHIVLGVRCVERQNVVFTYNDLCSRLYRHWPSPMPGSLYLAVSSVWWSQQLWWLVRWSKLQCMYVRIILYNLWVKSKVLIPRSQTVSLVKILMLVIWCKFIVKMLLSFANTLILFLYMFACLSWNDYFVVIIQSQMCYRFVMIICDGG